MAGTVARSSVVILFVFALAFIFLESTFAFSESPFIVAHKKVTLKRLDPATERVIVYIDVYNRGSVSAYDVTINDDTWNLEIFDSVRGNISKSWERLDAGAIVSHSFELETRVKGFVQGAPALVTFRLPSKSELQVAYSNPIMPLDILAEKATEGKLDLAKRLWATFGSHVSVVSLVGVFAYLITKPSKSSASKSGKKRN